MGEQMEEALMAEYRATFLRDKRVSVHLRLGWPPDVDPRGPDALRLRNLHLVWLPEADLVVHEDHGATIYEFAIWRPTQKVNQLLRYEKLLPQTPGYEDVEPDMIHKVLVAGVLDFDTRSFAEEHGVEVIEYLPPEIAAKLTERRGRR